MNKKFGFFLILGVAFFSLLTCSSTYAVDSISSDYSNSVYTLPSVQGFNRSYTIRGNAYYLAGCDASRYGDFTFYGKVGDNLVNYPCGFTHNNLVNGLPYDNIAAYSQVVSFGSSGRNYSNGSGISSVRDSLNHESYLSIGPHSVFNGMKLGYDFSGLNSQGGASLNVPASDSEYFDFIVFTNTNLNTYNYSFVPPVLGGTGSTTYIEVLSGSINNTEIRNTINAGIVSGMITEVDGVKSTTLYTKNCMDNIGSLSIDCDSVNSSVFPSDVNADFLEEYLLAFDIGTQYYIVPIPRSPDYSYRIYDFRIGTADSLEDYNYDFEELPDEEYYWGFPLAASPGYTLRDNTLDNLSLSLNSVFISQYYLNPSTAEAKQMSNYLFGRLVNAHNSSLTYVNGLSKVQDNPGSTFWSGIFSLDSLVFPFRNFFSGFTAAQCVNIPTLAGMLNLPSNQQYCTWWASGTRAVLTPIFNVASMMLLFGFVIHWVRKDNTDTIKEKR